jgi:carboxynorspermidine decarboxylase
LNIDISQLPTPSYVLEEKKLRENLELLKRVSDESGLKILMALKGFAFWKTFPLVKKYLHGISASGLNEALLGFEEFSDEVHTYSPAYNPDEIKRIVEISKTIIFNSFTQLEKYHDFAKRLNPEISIGIRLNPEFSTTKVDLYNPCFPFSRLGVTKKEFVKDIDRWIDKIDGFHFHALCEQGVEDLIPLYREFENKFGYLFDKLKWINMGGGHLITRKDYDIERLISFVKEVRRERKHLQFYIEPSEAIGWETGFLIAKVLDIVENGIKIAILDTSAEAHMPDVLAMPYRPNVVGDVKNGGFRYRFAGNSCLAGDVIGDYRFSKELKVGDKIIFKDMIHYTIVKNTTFNGLPLPSLLKINENGEVVKIKQFSYQDYKNRLS